MWGTGNCPREKFTTGQLLTDIAMKFFTLTFAHQYGLPHTHACTHFNDCNDWMKESCPTHKIYNNIVMGNGHRLGTTNTHTHTQIYTPEWLNIMTDWWTIVTNNFNNIILRNGLCVDTHWSSEFCHASVFIIWSVYTCCDHFPRLHC